MKNLKKTLALVVACLMLFGLAATAASPYPDVADDGTPLSEAVKVITALKVVEGDDSGNFNPTASITRAEMAKILCTMVNTGAIGQSVTIFDDTPSSHWASGYIATATGLNYIDGFGDGTFRPDEPVTYEQAVKLITCALGYRVYADTLGGYPTGYMIAAAERDVTKNAHGKMSEAAPRGTIAIMIYNALNAPIMKQTKYSSTLSEWEFMDGTKGNPYESLLNTKLNAYKVEGVVLATATSQIGGTSIKDGFVNYQVTNAFGVNGIDLGADTSVISKQFPLNLNNINATGTDADSLLYYMSTAYMQKNYYDELEIICIVSKFGRNDEFFLEDASLIFDPAEDSSYATSRPRDRFSMAYVNADANDKYIYSYWENSREDDSRMIAQQVDADAKIIWNGQYQGTLANVSSDAVPFAANQKWQQNVVRPLVGTVKLVDVDMDGIIDVVDSRNYAVGVVEGITTSNMSINFKEASTEIGGRIKLSKDDNPDLKSVKIVLDGEEIEYTELQENDVLNICTNDAKNPVFFDIIVTRESVEGAVRTHNLNNNSYEIEGWDEPLQVSKSLNTTIELELGDEGIFYLDMNGNIAFADMTPALTGEFGYLALIGSYEWDDIRAKIFNKAGEEVSYKIDNKLKINNVKVTGGIDKGLTSDQMFKMLGITENGAANLLNIYNGTFAAGATITPKMLLQAIGGEKSRIDGVYYTMKPALAATLTGTGNVKADRMINYTINNSNVITGITLPRANASANNRFTFVQGNVNTETQWSVKNGKFLGMKTLADAAVIFIIPSDDISDYKVMSKDALQDETKVNNVFAYCNLKDQGPSIVMLTSDVVSMGGFGIFSGYSRGAVDGQNVSNITYWTNGSRADTLVAYDADVIVDGNGIVNGEVADMRPGDVFTYDVNSRGEVTRIHVIFRAGTMAPTNFLGSIDLVDSLGADAFENWDVYGQNAAGKPAKVDNELYFGIVSKVSGSGTRNIVVAGEDGYIDSAETFRASSTAPITYYNPARTTSRRLEAGVVMDIVASSCLRASNGDLVLEFDASNNLLESTAKELTYVFVKLYKDEVEEIIYISYYL